MATSASRAHLIRQLARKGTSSPPIEDYATATGSSMSFDDSQRLLHSTPPQQRDITSQQQHPSHQHPTPPSRQRIATNYAAFPDHGSDAASESSTAPSIENGRARLAKYKSSSTQSSPTENPVMDLGNGSLYELVYTPPLNPPKQRTSAKKAEHSLRRQASTRTASQTSQSNEAPRRPSQRPLREALQTVGIADDTMTTEITEDNTVLQHTATATFNARNTRFTSSRQTSANAPAAAPRVTSAPSQATPRGSAQHNDATNSNSFNIPQLPDMTQLMAGRNNDGTPIQARNTKSHSRFTSAPARPSAPQGYEPAGNPPLPDEEKTLYASIQLLKERVGQLEADKSEAAKRAEEYENEVISLRSQLAASQRRPDSGLGSSDDDGAAARWKAEKKKYQATVKTLQEQLHRSERKTTVAEMTTKHVTADRDELITQIAAVSQSEEQLITEREQLTANIQKLEADNEHMQQQNNTLAANYRTENEQNGRQIDSLTKEVQDLRAASTRTVPQAHKRAPSIQESLIRAQPAIAASRRSSASPASARPGPASQRTFSVASSVPELNETSTSPGRPITAPQRTFSVVSSVPELNEPGDDTILSAVDHGEIDSMRKKLEGERRAGRIAKSVQITKAPAVLSNTKTDDHSVVSNTSRRRHRRAESEEGMTSAFIIPDITLDIKNTIPHKEDNCTACPQAGKPITIPTPIPVTDREADVGDITDATIRPSQPPSVALATVIKELEDEIKHFKIRLTATSRLYNQHDPALSKRRRMDVKIQMNRLTGEIEKRSDQVYALYDVLEGQKAAAAAAMNGTAEDAPGLMDESQVEDTLQSLGLDPAMAYPGEIGRGQEEFEQEESIDSQIFDGFSSGEEY